MRSPVFVMPAHRKLWEDYGVVVPVVEPVVVPVVVEPVVVVPVVVEPAVVPVVVEPAVVPDVVPVVVLPAVVLPDVLPDVLSVPVPVVAQALIKASEAQRAAPISKENWLRFISWQGEI